MKAVYNLRITVSLSIQWKDILIRIFTFDLQLNWIFAQKYDSWFPYPTAIYQKLINWPWPNLVQILPCNTTLTQMKKDPYIFSYISYHLIHRILVFRKGHICIHVWIMNGKSTCSVLGKSLHALIPLHVFLHYIFDETPQCFFHLIYILCQSQ